MAAASASRPSYSARSASPPAANHAAAPGSAASVWYVFPASAGRAGASCDSADRHVGLGELGIQLQDRGRFLLRELELAGVHGVERGVVLPEHRVREHARCPASQGHGLRHVAAVELRQGEIAQRGAVGRKLLQQRHQLFAGLVRVPRQQVVAAPRPVLLAVRHAAGAGEGQLVVLLGILPPPHAAGHGPHPRVGPAHRRIEFGGRLIGLEGLVVLAGPLQFLAAGVGARGLERRGREALGVFHHVGVGGPVAKFRADLRRGLADGRQHGVLVPRLGVPRQQRLVVRRVHDAHRELVGVAVLLDGARDHAVHPFAQRHQHGGGVVEAAAGLDLAGQSQRVAPGIRVDERGAFDTHGERLLEQAGEDRVLRAVGEVGDQHRHRVGRLRRLGRPAREPVGAAHQRRHEERRRRGKPRREAAVFRLGDQVAVRIQPFQRGREFRGRLEALGRVELHAPRDQRVDSLRQAGISCPQRDGRSATFGPSSSFHGVDPGGTFREPSIRSDRMSPKV